MVRLVAGAHLPWSRPDQVVATIKLAGWALHVATGVLILLALREPAIILPVLTGALLVAVHPDLISASVSVSGMEVPLAASFAALLLLAVPSGRFLPYLALAFVAPLARPELTLLSLTTN